MEVYGIIQIKGGRKTLFSCPAYPVKKVHKAMFKKWFEQLVRIGIFEQ